MQDILSKWGGAVAERGFAQIPNYLLQINLFVHDDHKLSPTEMLVLLQLVASWWKKDQMPFPSMRTLSERSGISERQVQRAIKGLEIKGYLKRTKSKLKGIIASNTYDLIPTVDMLRTVAEHYVNKHPRNIKNKNLLALSIVEQPPKNRPYLNVEINPGDVPGRWNCRVLVEASSSGEHAVELSNVTPGDLVEELHRQSAFHASQMNNNKPLSVYFSKMMPQVLASITVAR
ncbi:MAG: helix-turn-helix domain-containing protein [Alphaproteobacteria bacterium]